MTCKGNCNQGRSCDCGKTRFADDDTIRYIAALEAKLATAREALEMCESAFDECRDYPITRDAVIEALAALGDAPPVSAEVKPVPDGWQLVPKEPTPEMISAMENQWLRGSQVDMAKREYKAMLAAAPTPASAEVKSVPDGWQKAMDELEYARECLFRVTGSAFMGGESEVNSGRLLCAELVRDANNAVALSMELLGMEGAAPTPPQQPRQEWEGHVVVTKNPQGQIVAVTRQDDDGRVMSVIAESEPRQESEIAAEALEANKHVSVIIKALADIAQLPDQSKKESDPEVIPRDSVMREIPRIRDAAYALRQLAAQQREAGK